MRVAAPPLPSPQPDSGRTRARAESRAASLILVGLSCVWLVLCVVFLALLIPPTTTEGLAFRCVIAVLPPGLLWVFLSAGQGKSTAMTVLMVIILVLSDLSLRNRAYNDTSLDAQTLTKTALWGLGLLVAIFNWRRLTLALREPAVAFLVALCLWFVFTSLYSPIRAYSFGSSVALLSVVVFGAVVRQVVPDKLLLNAAIGGIGVLLWLSLVLYVVAPGMAMASQEGGQVLRLAAPFGTPNSLGRAAALVLLMCVVGVHGKTLTWRSPWVLGMGFAALACIVLSQSRTAAVALVGAIAILLLVERIGRLIAASVVALVCAMLIFSVDLNLAELAAKISRSGRVSDVVTLTGRTEIWSFIWGEIEKSPWFGYGYSSTRVLLPQLYRTFWGWTPAHAHNMWLQTWFVSGIVGVALLSTVIVAQFRYWLQSRDTISLAFLVFVFVMGLTEAGHLDGAPSILTVLWALFLVGRRRQLASGNTKQPSRSGHPPLHPPVPVAPRMGG